MSNNGFDSVKIANLSKEIQNNVMQKLGKIIVFGELVSNEMGNFLPVASISLDAESPEISHLGYLVFNDDGIASIEAEQGNQNELEIIVQEFEKALFKGPLFKMDLDGNVTRIE